MSRDRETNLALFIDFDNVALGARDARQRFDVKLLLQRVLEKGKIIVKRAYADWHHYKEHMLPLHEAAIELIEIPMPRISGKNSADIRLVVDAMDLCYSKDHVDTFVIVSGDSDFSPLVSKLRENDKRVIGIGVRNSSSKLLIGNCDEFIFYDDIYRDTVGQLSKSVTHVPADKRELFDFLVKTAQSLLQESRGVLYSSLIKDTMTRKQPDFNERSYGYANFGDLLDDARRLGLLVVERDARAGGTWVVQGLGKGKPAEGEETAEGNGKSRSGRRRRRSGRGRDGEAGRADAKEAAAGEGESTAASEAGPEAESEAKTTKKSEAKAADKPAAAGRSRARSRSRARAAKAAAPADEAAGGKETAKKTTKKAPAKKTTKKAPAKKTTKKAPAKKTTKKAPAKKTTKKAPAKKTTKKTPAKKTTKKAPAKKTTKKAPAGG